MNRCCIWFSALALSIALAMAGCGKPAGSSQAGKADSAASAAPPKPSSAPAAAQGESGNLTTARAVLEKMAAAYRNAASYEDFATVELRRDPMQAESDTRQNLSVKFVRPNKLQAELLYGHVVCDGKQWYGSCALVPGEAVLREAPAKISMDILGADYWLYLAMSDNGHGKLSAPQLQLLLDRDPIQSLVCQSEDVKLDEPGRLGDYECYRVGFAVPGGTGELWIDKKTFALRMYMLPVAAPPATEQRDAQPVRRWLVINFERARLGGDIDQGAFRFQMVPGVKQRRVIVNGGPAELIGEKLPEFKFRDLRGNPWSSQSLAGKPAIIHFWRSDDVDGFPMAAQVGRLQETYKNNDKVAVLSVSLDPPDTPANFLEDAAKQMKIVLPPLRDDGGEAHERLKIIGERTTLFIDARGVLQDCIIGHSPATTASMPRRFERLIAGEDLARRARDEFQEQVKAMEITVDAEFAGKAQSTTLQQVHDAPAAKSPPAKLRLQTIWNRRWDPDRRPGNLLVVPDSGGKARILMVDGFKSISELGLDGKILGTFSPKLAEGEFFAYLRSAASGAPGQRVGGKRFYVAFAPGQQRFHLFDEKLNHVQSIPVNALADRHAGLSDVALGDLDGDGVLKAYVGFAGTVGVKCFSLQGNVLWSCRNLINIGAVVPGPAGVQGRRDLFCVYDAASIAVLDAKGDMRDTSRLIAEGTVRGLVRADLTGDGRGSWCGMMFVCYPQQTSGQFTALGLDAGGAQQWKYALPAGNQQVVEPIVVGRVLPGPRAGAPAAQWLLPGSDGSVHILAADGTLVDRFNYGAQINGLATVEIDGKPVLLISSANGVEALRVE